LVSKPTGSDSASHHKVWGGLTMTVTSASQGTPGAITPIVATPWLTAVTVPKESTVATRGLLEVKLKSPPVIPDESIGVKVAVWFVPVFKVSPAGLTVKYGQAAGCTGLGGTPVEEGAWPPAALAAAAPALKTGSCAPLTVGTPGGPEMAACTWQA